MSRFLMGHAAHWEAGTQFIERICQRLQNPLIGSRYPVDVGGCAPSARYPSCNTADKNILDAVSV